MLNIQTTNASNENQLIIFSLGNEEFGLNVLGVQEIIRYIKPTQIPRAPFFVEGVIDFRGEIIPVLNMRERLGLPSKDCDSSSVIIIVESNKKIMGLIVDLVSDIRSITEDKIHPNTDLSVNEKTEYFKAMGKLDDRLIIIPDLNKLMVLDELEL